MRCVVVCLTLLFFFPLAPPSPQPSISQAGRYMVTSGLDSQMKARGTFACSPVSQYYTSRPATTRTSLSETFRCRFGAHVQIWKDALRTKAKSPYMRHAIPGSVMPAVALIPTV